MTTLWMCTTFVAFTDYDSCCWKVFIALMSYQKISFPVMKIKKRPFNNLMFGFLSHPAAYVGNSLFEVSLSQTCLSMLYCIHRLVSPHTSTETKPWQTSLTETDSWQEYLVCTHHCHLICVLTLFRLYLSYSQPAKCAKWSQVSACPHRVNECMNNR